MVQAAPLRNKALALIQAKPVLRARDFSDAGIPRNYLQRLTAEGRLVQIARGLYEAPDRPLSAGASLAEVALWSPKATITLLSALQYHQITTQTPHQIWVLLGLKDWTPVAAPITLRIIRAQGEALTAGIDRHPIDGMCALHADHAIPQRRSPIASSIAARRGWTSPSRRFAMRCTAASSRPPNSTTMPASAASAPSCGPTSKLSFETAEAAHRFARPVC